uniref:uncharacterized protein LOC109952612 n=1 Tax=Monopterus albus TaxID=43700 RepID=UPI0009B4375E|nr:uncharacterized protein LOC109952612 [Monopterus albus]
MKSFLLLTLTLMAGREASSDKLPCTKGWVEFTCKYPNRNKNYATIEVHYQPETVRSTEKDKWQSVGRYFLYHDTQSEKLRVAIKKIQYGDSDDYKCVFFPGQHKTKVKGEEMRCRRPLTQTAYTTAKTTITCNNPANGYRSTAEFFCKEGSSSCGDLLSDSSSKSNGRFTFTNTGSGFTVSISNVSSQDEGVYWCGVKPDKGSDSTGLTQIQLKVQNISTFTASPAVGQDLMYWCGYHSGTYENKFICKGEDPSTCQRLVSTNQGSVGRRFSMKDDKSQSNITVTVRRVTADDTGTYWCGAESTDSGHRNQFLHRYLITVGECSDHSYAEIQEHPQKPASGTELKTVYATVNLPPNPSAFMFYSEVNSSGELGHPCHFCFLAVNKPDRTCSSLPGSQCSRNTGHGAQNNTEDHSYAEIQEHPQKPASGTELKTVYATVNLPPNPSAFMFYSEVNSSGEVSGDTYSAVRDDGQH